MKRNLAYVLAIAAVTLAAACDRTDRSGDTTSPNGVNNPNGSGNTNMQPQGSWGPAMNRDGGSGSYGYGDRFNDDSRGDRSGTYSNREAGSVSPTTPPAGYAVPGGGTTGTGTSGSGR